VKWWAHVACATLFVLAVRPSLVLDYYLVIAGAVFPDAVERVVGARHRALHELALYAALLALSAPVGALAFSLAALNHVLVDALTVRGVTVLGRRVRWVLNTNSVLHNLAVVLLHYGAAALLAR